MAAHIHLLCQHIPMRSNKLTSEVERDKQSHFSYILCEHAFVSVCTCHRLYLRERDGSKTVRFFNILVLF